MLQNFSETGKNGDGSIVTDIIRISILKGSVILTIFKASGKSPYSMDFSN